VLAPARPCPARYGWLLGDDDGDVRFRAVEEAEGGPKGGVERVGLRWSGAGRLARRRRGSGSQRRARQGKRERGDALLDLEPRVCDGGEARGALARGRARWRPCMRACALQHSAPRRVAGWARGQAV
jgi:hypothetical protein